MNRSLVISAWISCLSALYKAFAMPSSESSCPDLSLPCQAHWLFKWQATLPQHISINNFQGLVHTSWPQAQQTSSMKSHYPMYRLSSAIAGCHATQRKQDKQDRTCSTCCCNLTVSGLPSGSIACLLLWQQHCRHSAIFILSHTKAESH